MCLKNWFKQSTKGVHVSASLSYTVFHGSGQLIENLTENSTQHANTFLYYLLNSILIFNG